MTVRDRVLRVLGSSAAQRIDFRVNWVHVDAAMFQEVRAAVEDGFIEVAPWRGHAGEAGFVPQHDTIMVGSGSSASDALLVDASIAHEAVHAYCEIHRMTGNDPYSEEAIGYLTQALYLGHLSHWDQNSLPALREACRVADLPHLRLRRRRGVSLSRSDIEPIRAAVQAMPTYSDHYGDRTTMPEHDGVTRSVTCGLFGGSQCHLRPGPRPTPP